ncbi:hypothetical protein Plhal304r1_c064g0151701 [Plasmopara halstedii]
MVSRLRATCSLQQGLVTALMHPLVHQVFFVKESHSLLILQCTRKYPLPRWVLRSLWIVAADPLYALATKSVRD